MNIVLLYFDYIIVFVLLFFGVVDPILEFFEFALKGKPSDRMLKYPWVIKNDLMDKNIQKLVLSVIYNGVLFVLIYNFYERLLEPLSSAT